MSAVFTPTRAQLNVDQFHRMGELGILVPDVRLELIDGEMLTIAPIGRHAWMVEELGKLLRQQAGDRALVWSQNPVRLSDVDEPQPDIMVLIPRPGHYRDSLPTGPDVLLVIEVADTTVAYDRETKLGLYARHGIQEAWIVNIRDGRLEIYRDPAGGVYRMKLERNTSDTASPLCLQDLSVALAALLSD
jgi:Uma2 family endonuclease